MSIEPLNDSSRCDMPRCNRPAVTHIGLTALCRGHVLPYGRYLRQWWVENVG